MIRVLSIVFLVSTVLNADTFQCRGKKASAFTGVEGIRPSDTRFISRQCRVGGPALIKTSGYILGTNRCYNFSISCGLRGSTLTVFTRTGKRVGRAIPRFGCPNGRGTYDLPINASTLARKAGKAGYLIAQVTKGNTVRCYPFRPTCAIRLGQEVGLDPRKYSGVDRPSGAKPACGRFRAPNPIAPEEK
jgi:hypothetical protein